ncbi:unnamed protein product [Eretmochelys imbricata]
MHEARPGGEAGLLRLMHRASLGEQTGHPDLQRGCVRVVEDPSPGTGWCRHPEGKSVSKARNRTAPGAPTFPEAGPSAGTSALPHPPPLGHREPAAGEPPVEIRGLLQPLHRKQRLGVYLRAGLLLPLKGLHHRSVATNSCDFVGCTYNVCTACQTLRRMVPAHNEKTHYIVTARGPPTRIRALLH